MGQDVEQLRKHYESLADEAGFACRCSMQFPSDLEGKRILDLGCRRGRGAVKLADCAGAGGSVIGVDWNEGNISHARERAGEMAHGIIIAPLEFRVGYPEAIDAAGIAGESIDMAFVNCSFNLFFDQPSAIGQIARALAPKGMLVVDGVFADHTRDKHVVDAARKLGNSIQAAPSFEDFGNWLAHAGLHIETVDRGEIVLPDAAGHHGLSSPVVETDEQAMFHICMVLARKNS